MGRVRSSCRRTRSRLSRIGSTRRLLATKSVRSGGKRDTSRVDRNVVNQVAKELNFTELNGTPLPSASRRRSDRLLKRNSLEATALLMNPTTPSLIRDGVRSKEKLIEASALQMIELVPGDNNKIVESMFGDVFDKASLLKVEVEQCVSLPELRVRPLHQFGIQRAVHILRGNSIGCVTGHVCVGKFPVVAALPEEYRERILEYFCKQGREREASERFIASKKFYQVINGGYEHEGRWRLIDSSGYEFAGVKWRTVEIPWQDPKILRAISMMSNQVQKKEFVVDLSFSDEMVHLRRIIEEHTMENAIVLKPGKPLPRGFSRDISKAYSGGKDYSNNTLRHLISIAAKMSTRTTLLMRKIVDAECPLIAKSLHRKNPGEDSTDIIDTRVFRTLINSKSLRGAKVFFAPDTNDEDRYNALHRLRYIAQEKGSYKGVDPMTLDKQIGAAILGRKAVEKFCERILRRDVWPAAMKPLLCNILQTTKLDIEIEENSNRPDELPAVLKHNYLECAGAEGGTRVEQYEKFILDRAHMSKKDTAKISKQPGNNLSASSQVERDDIAAANDLLDDAHLDPPVDTEDKGKSNKSQRPVSTGGVDTPGVDSPSTSQEEDDNLVEDPEPVLNPLQQCNIEVHARTWEDYNKAVLNEQETFDFIFSDPFQKAATANVPVIDGERRIDFVKFIKKVLVPGGFVFLIVPQLQMSAWLDAFEEFELKPEGVFTLVKDPDFVQKVKGKSFQHLVEVAAVARKSGRHPKKFVMDVVSPYTQLPRNRYKRRSPLIDNICPPANRLHFPRSKTLVRTGEKPPGLVWELMKTFSPPGGKVLDPCAGTLTTGIAGIQSGRSCVLLESDQQCLSLAEARLNEIAINKLQEADAGNLLTELGTHPDGLRSTISAERRETSLSSLSLHNAGLHDLSEHDIEVFEERDMDIYGNKGSHSGSEDVGLSEKDVMDKGAGSGQENEGGNNFTQLPVADIGSELRIDATRNSCPEKPHQDEALDQKPHELNGSSDQSNVFNSSQGCSGDSKPLEALLETPKNRSARGTRKRQRRNQAGDLAPQDAGPTSSRPQRKRKRNIRYG